MNFITLKDSSKFNRRIRKALSVLMRVTLFVALQLISTIFNPLVAQDIYDLVRSNNVEVTAWLGSDPKVQKPTVSINEQLILYVEVATPRWLTGGTHLGMIEIPNVIIKQRNTLATNYTERAKGQTWSRQRWEVTLYPIQSGEYIVPPIPVSVEVSAPNREKVRGTLYTQPIEFNAQLPTGTLTDSSEWFAASDVKVSQKWDIVSDDLKVGDAIRRTVTVEAKDSLSVLLPTLLEDKSPIEYQTYLQPRLLEDTQVRGAYRSVSMEEGVYIVQTGGEITLPPLVFEWWNSNTKQLEKVTVQGARFKAHHTPSSFIRAYGITTITVLIASTLFAWAVWFVRRQVKARLASSALPVTIQLLIYMYRKQWAAARTLLYKKLRLNLSLLELTKFENTTSWQMRAVELQQGSQKTQVFAKVYYALWRVKHAKWKVWFKIPRALPQLEQKQKQNNLG